MYAMRRVVCPSVVIALAALACATEATAQDATALRAAFEGTTAAPRIDMPGTSDGVSIYPAERMPLDYANYRQQLARYGAAIPAGKTATITLVKVKKNNIEIQLDDGGYGTLSDQVVQANNQAGQADPDEAVRQLRLTRGSRFNIRYRAPLQSDQLTPDAVKAALAKYLDFAPAASPAPQVAQSQPPAPVPSPATLSGADSSLAPAPAPARPSGASWKPTVGWDHELFPSFIIATANAKNPGPPDAGTLGDPFGVIGVRVKSPAAGTHVTVTVSSTGLMEASTFDTVLPTAGDTYIVYPSVAWDFTALERVRQTRPASVTIRVLVEGQPAGQVTERVTLHSINDCPYFVVTEDWRGRQQPQGMGWMFAAYVNENHPWNDQLRKQALQAGIVAQFTGYQTGDPREVVRQVYAIWNVLQRLGTKYSSITTTPIESAHVQSQQVRFLDQSVSGAQANCVDGSVLFASLMREIGIDPVLVMVPGHMFVGFFMDPAHRQVFYLETTMLGEADLSPAGDPLGLRQVFGNDRSWNSFTAAWESATTRETQEATALKAGKPGYTYVDVAAVRRIGILPIAFSE